MKVPLLIVAAVFALTVALTACGGDEEVAPDVTPAATAASPTTAVPSAPPTPSPSPAAIPAGFVAYSHAATKDTAAFSFSYPEGWDITAFDPPPGSYGISIVLFSFDHLAWSRPEFPPGSMKVDVGVAPVDLCAGSGGAEVTLGGTAAVKTTTTFPDHPKGVTMGIDVRGERAGFCYSITGFFAQESPDEATFNKIVESFRFQ